MPASSPSFALSGGQINSGGVVSSSANYLLSGCLDLGIGGQSSSASHQVEVGCAAVFAPNAASVLEIPSLQSSGTAVLIACLLTVGVRALRRRRRFETRRTPTPA